jgi:hypothetical protein
LRGLAVSVRKASVLNKVLAIAFVGIVLGKLFFRPQLRALGKWFDGVINAFLIAIGIAYTIQLFIYLSSR